MLHPSARSRVALLSLQFLFAFTPFATSAATRVSSGSAATSVSSTSGLTSTFTNGPHGHPSPQHPEAVQSAEFLPIAVGSSSTVPVTSASSSPSIRPSLGGAINHSAGNTPVAPIAVNTATFEPPGSSNASVAPLPASTPTAIQSVPSNAPDIAPAPTAPKSAGGGGNGGGDETRAQAPTATQVQNLNALSSAVAVPNQQEGGNTAASATSVIPASQSAASNQPVQESSLYASAVSGVSYLTIATGENPATQISSITYAATGTPGYTAVTTPLPTGTPLSASIEVPVSDSSATGYISSTALAPYPSIRNGTATSTYASFGTIGTLVPFSFSHHSSTKSSVGTSTSTALASATSDITESPKPTATPKGAGLRLEVRPVTIWAVMVGLLLGAMVG